MRPPRGSRDPSLEFVSLEPVVSTRRGVYVNRGYMGYICDIGVSRALNISKEFVHSRVNGGP